jgi:hypothetical protein
MKNISKLSILVLMVAFASCKDTKTENSAESTTVENSDNAAAGQLYACSMHPEVTGKKGESCSKCGMDLTEPVAQSAAVSEGVKVEKAAVTAFSSTVDLIVGDYLVLKNALVKDDSKAAANAGKALYATLNTANTTSIDAKLEKEYTDIVDDAKEHAEHIGDNSGKLDHQREHFALLSKDVNDLIQTFGTNKKLYQEYCPMYDQGKSGYWISDSKEIKNPYYGAEMLSCGRVEKEM